MGIETNNADEEFETRIVVRTNMAEVPWRELARPGWTGERVAIGTATDVYQPVEGRYQLTRRVLGVMRDFRNPLSLITKSTLVLRDVGILAELARRAEVRVSFTITTLDPELWRLVEPGTPPPASRLRVLARLAAAGVPCGVNMAPILPGLTHTDAAIAAVAAAARDHGATSFWAAPLRLAPLVKEHDYAFVARQFPDLLRRCQCSYPGAGAPDAYREQLQERIAAIKTLYDFGDRSSHDLAVTTEPRIPARPRTGARQLALPL
ncbi:MAG: radical SAM protein [Chloroflexota bacterium]|nr:radical SAM protein [Chloroflexota bacterium]